jgi:hypothetical protein
MPFSQAEDHIGATSVMEDQSETNTTAATQPVAASDGEPAEVKATPETLTAIIKLLEPLSSAQRQRTVAAAMMFLGEAPLEKPRQEKSGGSTDNDDGGGEGDYSPQITKWMKQNEVSAEELDRVFHFNGDGTFDLLHAPGKSKKEQTVNTYVLTGLGKYLTANDRAFDDATARANCEKIGCFDKSNHATHIKNQPEFTGDRSKGYSITNPGIKRGAALVKEVAGG